MAKVSLRTGQLRRLGRLSAKNPGKAEQVAGRMVERRSRVSRGQEYLKKNVDKLMPEVPTIGKKGLKVSKAKKGGSFPDLNKDGKITKADILKGRGVIKNGGKMKKARGGATISPSKSSTSNRLASYGRPIGKNLSGKLKSGGKVKKAMGGMKMGKCKYGC